GSMALLPMPNSPTRTALAAEPPSTAGKRLVRRLSSGSRPGSRGAGRFGTEARLTGFSGFTSVSTVRTFMLGSGRLLETGPTREIPQVVAGTGHDRSRGDDGRTGCEPGPCGGRPSRP